MDYFNSLTMETENMKLFLTLTGMTIDKWKMKMIQMESQKPKDAFAEVQNKSYAYGEGNVGND